MGQIVVTEFITLDGVAEDPGGAEGFADRFNALPKYVVSKTLDKGDWGDTTILRGELSTDIANLRQRHDGDILVSGSIGLVRALLAADLVDELRLMLFPVVLGSGKRLFADNAEPAALRLVSSRPAGETVILTLGRRDDTGKARSHEP